MARPAAPGKVGCLRRRACTLVFSSAEMTNSELCRGSWKDPTPVLPGTKGIGTQPTPQGRAADLGHYALSHRLLANIRQGQARERQPEPMRKLTSQSFYLPDDAWGKRGRDARLEVVPRGPVDELEQIACATCSRSGGECPSRAAMRSLDRPWAARSTILALMTSRYGEVYLRALLSSSFCSSLVRAMRNWLCLGKKEIEY